jgi:hypothetical protein
VATVHGEESAWLRLLVAKRTAALGAYGVILVATVIGLAAHDGDLAVALLVLGIAFACTRRGLVRRYRYAIEGAAGERETAKMLALLPGSFTVLNDFAFSGFNVDHVVVGPTGVWAIETKSQPGLVEERDDTCGSTAARCTATRVARLAAELRRSPSCSNVRPASAIGLRRSSASRTQL